MPPSATAQIQITAGTAGLSAGLNAGARMLKGFASGAAGAVKSVGGALANIGSRAAGHFVGGMATRGLDLIVEQGHNVLKFEEALVRLGLASRKSGVELRQIGNEARALSTATGIDAVEVLRGARAYVDLAGAENYTAEKMSLITRTAQASGSDISDVATEVYSLSQALHVTGPELENTMGGLLNQSKSGAIHFRQMAQEMVSLAPTFSQFGITGREGAIRLGAALQIVRTGFGSASEAGTGMQRLMRALPQHAKLFEKGGVQIFKKGSRSELLSLDQIMDNIYKSKLRLDRPALIKAFGRGEAERAFQLFQGSGTDENGKLVNNIDLYHQLIEAGRVNGTIQADLATYTESSSGKIAMAVEKMKNGVAVAFTPERVAAFADLLTRAADSFMRAASWIDSHVGVSETDVRKIRTAEFHDAVTEQQKTDRTSPSAQAERARQLQNYHRGDDVPGYIQRLVNKMDTAGAGVGGDNVEGLVHDVGIRMGEELRAKGVSGSMSAGAMVQQDQERAAGAAYLKKMGWNTPGSVADDAARANQEAVIADAVRKAMEPALRNLARAFGTAPPSVLKIDGNPVATSVANAPDQRRSP